MTPDLVNALFEGFGGLMHWTNVRAIYRDKQIRGVNVWATVLFNFWGAWNLWYYPHLGQWASFWGGLVIVSANSVWVWLALRYVYYLPRHQAWWNREGRVKQKIKRGQKIRCQADRDGDCVWTGCPQLRDNEPSSSGRHCPLDVFEEEP